jgi:hypothetical protein
MEKSMGAAKLQRAREYILAHKDESKSQQILGTGLSEGTISTARRDLVAEGKLPPDRKITKTKLTEKAAEVPAPLLPQTTAEGMPQGGDTVRDSAAMFRIAEMIDESVDKGNDADVVKLLLRQALKFATDPDLHPDTRMSASQMWHKLKDMTRAKDLGPGVPKTRADAVARVRDVLITVGPEITVEAVHAAFEIKGPSDEGNVPAKYGEATPSATGTTPTS